MPMLDGVMLLLYLPTAMSVGFVAIDMRSTSESPVVKWGFVLLTDLTGLFWTKRCEKMAWKGALVMPKKRFNAEQIAALLRQIEVSIAQGRSAAIACIFASRVAARTVRIEWNSNVKRNHAALVCPDGDGRRFRGN